MVGSYQLRRVPLHSSKYLRRLVHGLLLLGLENNELLAVAFAELLRVREGRHIHWAAVIRSPLALRPPLEINFKVYL